MKKQKPDLTKVEDEPATIEIDKGDAAIVFRADGSMEIVLTEQADDEPALDVNIKAMLAATQIQDEVEYNRLLERFSVAETH